MKLDSVVSQCSTVVRNTVVRATIKVNGKHPILNRQYGVGDSKYVVISLPCIT